ncbi:MAG: hypothetical protein IH626_05520, partial [Rhodospirillales bacterium]|nr:hypothetical protein [Rhodospirillales bacterium]
MAYVAISERDDHPVTVGARKGKGKYAADPATITVQFGDIYLSLSPNWTVMVAGVRGVFALALSCPHRHLVVVSLADRDVGHCLPPSRTALPVPR